MGLAFGVDSLHGFGPMRVQYLDNVSMAAFALAVAAGGAVKASKTTPLMTIEEGLQAMSKAGGSTYRPPS